MPKRKVMPKITKEEFLARVMAVSQISSTPSESW